MKILRSLPASASPIGARPFALEGVSSVEIAAGDGEAHAYVLFFEAGGLIDQHEAGFGQLFFALSGDGWVAGDDGVRQSLRQGEAAFIARGEAHAKGSDTGLTALMFQVLDLEPVMP